MSEGQPQISPITYKEGIRLSTIGVPIQHYDAHDLYLASHQYLCIREHKDSGSTTGEPSPVTALYLIDLITHTSSRLPITPDAAIVHPLMKLVALRAAHNLYIYDLDGRKKLKSTTIQPDDGDLVYWGWINPATIVIVNEHVVYHWPLQGDTPPILVFHRSLPKMVDQHLVTHGYTSSIDGKFLMILSDVRNDDESTTSGDTPATSIVELYRYDTRQQHTFHDTSAACFLYVHLEGRDPQVVANLLWYVQQERVYVVELDVPRTSAHSASSSFEYETAHDYIHSLLPDHTHGCVWMITKFGTVMLWEGTSATCIWKGRITDGEVVACVESSLPQRGILIMDSFGRLSTLTVNEHSILSYIYITCDDYPLALSMAKRYGWNGSEYLKAKEISAMIASGHHMEAMAMCVAAPPESPLRNQDTIRALSESKGGIPLLLQYFQTLLTQGKLNAAESLELCRLVLEKGGIDYVKQWQKENKLEASESLGDLLFQQHHYALALSMYLRTKVPQKVVLCMMYMGAEENDTNKARDLFKQIFNFSAKANYQPDYTSLLQTLSTINEERGKEFSLLLMSEGRGNDVAPTLGGDINTGPNDAVFRPAVLRTNSLSLQQQRDAFLQSSIAASVSHPVLTNGSTKRASITKPVSKPTTTTATPTTTAPSKSTSTLSDPLPTLTPDTDLLSSTTSTSTSDKQEMKKSPSSAFDDLMAGFHASSTSSWTSTSTSQPQKSPINEKLPAGSANRSPSRSPQRSPRDTIENKMSSMSLDVPVHKPMTVAPIQPMSKSSSRLTSRRSSSSQTPMSQVIEANTVFGIKILHQLYHHHSTDEKSSNIIFSPFALSLAMCTLANGCLYNQQAADEIVKTICLEDIDLANQQYQQVVQAVTRGDGDDVTIHLINTIWCSSIKTTFDAVIAAVYASKSAPLTTKAGINETFATRSSGTLPPIYPSSTLNTTWDHKEQSLVVVNAMSIQGQWSIPFRSVMAPFTSHGHEHSIPMWTTSDAWFHYWENEFFQTVDIPMGNKSYVAMIILPRSNIALTMHNAPSTLPHISHLHVTSPRQLLDLFVSQPTLLPTIMEQMELAKGELTFPQLTMESSMDVTELIQVMGAKAMMGDKIWTSATTNKQAKLAEIRHTVSLTLHNESSSTPPSDPSLPASVKIPSFIMHVNSPYLMLIRQKSNNAVLMACYVDNPVAEKH